jgi:flagellar biosynthesis/type III secretory pathway protein FliH
MSSARTDADSPWKLILRDYFPEAISWQMPYITSVEEIGFERGFKQGIEQGLEQGLEQGSQQGQRRGSQDVVLLLLEQRLGKISPALKEHIAALSQSQINALAIALLNFSTLSDLEAWLTQSS